MEPKRMVLLASGSGSNVENIAHYFRDETRVAIVGVLANKRHAAVLDRCERLGLPAFYFNRTAFDNGAVAHLLKALDPDLIVLAGFLWKISPAIVQAFPDKIVNIHPALLPKYGGKGMYGMRVHEAVKAGGDPETGITIHYVNESYDEGAAIHRAKVALDPADTPEAIAEKVHALEYEHFPRILAKLLGL